MWTFAESLELLFFLFCFVRLSVKVNLHQILMNAFFSFGSVLMFRPLSVDLPITLGAI